MTQQQLGKYLWGAATALRGTIDAGDNKQYIFPLLSFKRICDVYDEGFETALTESGGDMEYAAFAEHHHFLVPDNRLYNTYEYLIKEFADNRGNTASEFYTNRTVVVFMDKIIDFLTVKGSIEPSMLFVAPFTEINSSVVLGLFDERVATRIVSLIEDLDRNVNIA
jgi:type I restriction-modification system DNA methylase subunit